MQLTLVGKRAVESISKQSDNVSATFTDVQDATMLQTAGEIIDGLSNSFVNGEIDEVYCLYNEFKSAIAAHPVIRQLLPVEPAQPQEGEFPEEYIYEPSAEALLEGLVPHYVDRDHPVVAAAAARGITIVDPFLPPREFIAAVAAAELVASSSLHGMIVADALGIPNAWVELSDGVLGRGYKFRDHLALFGMHEPEPLQLTDVDQLVGPELAAVRERYERPGLDAIRERLVSSFPL